MLTQIKNGWLSNANAEYQILTIPKNDDIIVNIFQEELLSYFVGILECNDHSANPMHFFLLTFCWHIL